MKTILVPVDFSDVTEKVLRTAADYSRAFGGCRIVLAHVVEMEPQILGYEPGPLNVGVPVVANLNADQRRLDAYKDLFPGDDVLVINVQGSTPDEILDLAQEHQADLIVMGAHSHGALYQLLAGSVASAVLKDATCPILLVPRDRTKARK